MPPKKRGAKKAAAEPVAPKRTRNSAKVEDSEEIPEEEEAEEIKKEEKPKSDIVSKLIAADKKDLSKKVFQVDKLVPNAGSFKVLTLNNALTFDLITDNCCLRFIKIMIVC